MVSTIKERNFPGLFAQLAEDVFAEGRKKVNPAVLNIDSRVVLVHGRREGTSSCRQVMRCGGIERIAWNVQLAVGKPAGNSLYCSKYEELDCESSISLE
jgi:hypothetical protein